jgi:hypothetical protein
MAETAPPDDWNIIYWVMRTHGLIALEFKDFSESVRVFRKLKNMCKIRQKPKHQMHLYRQLAYIYKE